MSIIQFLFTKVFWKQVAFAIIGAAFIIFLVFQWLKFTTNHNQKIEVPNLSKQVLSDVEKILDDMDLSFVVIDSASYNPNYPKKSVIRQNPEAGDIVKENRKIYLTLNPSGYRSVAIPDFYGKTRRNIETTLRATGFTIGKDPTWVTDRGKNVVRGLKHKGKEIKKGDKLPKKSVINLVIGDGKG